MLYMKLFLGIFQDVLPYFVFAVNDKLTKALQDIFFLGYMHPHPSPSGAENVPRPETETRDFV